MDRVFLVDLENEVSVKILHENFGFYNISNISRHLNNHYMYSKYINCKAYDNYRGLSVYEYIKKYVQFKGCIPADATFEILYCWFIKNTNFN